MTPAEIRADAWSLLLDYAAETGTLASECEHAGLDAEEVARLCEKSAAIRAAASALAGMCVLDVEVVRRLIDAATAFDIRLANDSQTLAAAIAEVRRVESIPH